MTVTSGKHTARGPRGQRRRGAALRQQRRLVALRRALTAQPFVEVREGSEHLALETSVRLRQRDVVLELLVFPLVWAEGVTVAHLCQKRMNQSVYSMNFVDFQS